MLFGGLAGLRHGCVQPGRTPIPECGGAIGHREKTSASDQPQRWNWHVQNTDILQGYRGSTQVCPGPNSLPAGGEVRETVSADLLAGVRLWRGAEAHVDGLMWQGFGVGNALGVEGFPNGEAFRLGTSTPDVTITRLFIRQTIRLGGDEEKVEDDELTRTWPESGIFRG